MKKSSLETIFERGLINRGRAHTNWKKIGQYKLVRHDVYESEDRVNELLVADANFDTSHSKGIHSIQFRPSWTDKLTWALGKTSILLFIFDYWNQKLSWKNKNKLNKWLSSEGKGILTGRFAVGPRSELNVRLITAGGLGTQISLQGLSHHSGSDVGIVDIAEMETIVVSKGLYWFKGDSA